MTYGVTGPYFDCLKLPIWLVYHTFPKTRDPKDNKKLFDFFPKPRNFRVQLMSFV